MLRSAGGGMYRTVALSIVYHPHIKVVMERRLVLFSIYLLCIQVGFNALTLFIIFLVLRRTRRFQKDNHPNLTIGNCHFKINLEVALEGHRSTPWQPRGQSVGCPLVHSRSRSLSSCVQIIDVWRQSMTTYSCIHTVTA